MSRQNYYARRRQRRRRVAEGGLVAELVRQERHWQPRLGGRKLRVLLAGALARAGVSLGRDRFFKVLREYGLLVGRARSGTPCTTQSGHSWPRFSNLIQERPVGRPNEVWVADLTYVRTEEGFLYLALLTDQRSRQIVGYHCGDTLESVGCQEALKMALAQLPAGKEVIHHSDRGVQYCCRDYVELARAGGVRMSMTQTNHCAENALAERMNGILKGEYGLGQTLKTKAQARQLTKEGVWLYNTRRPHSALQYQTPAEVHRQRA
jgi:transposase InsO family protein